MRMNPQQRKRLLTKRARHSLESMGYGLVKKQGGGFLITDGESEEILAEFPRIEQVGIFFHLWGEDFSDRAVEESEESAAENGIWQKLPDRDPKSGLDTPEMAAVREQG